MQQLRFVHMSLQRTSLQILFSVKERLHAAESDDNSCKAMLQELDILRHKAGT